MSENVRDKVIVITGASSGLGEAAVRRLAAKGAKIVMGARRIDRLQAVAQEVVAAGGQVQVKATDVVDLNQVKALVAAAVDAYGRIDVMINNAGIMPLSLLESGRVEEWNRSIDVNLRGVLHGIAAALPHMQEQKSGHIINVSSVAGHKVGPGSSVYSATKTAVRVLTEGLRQEVKSYNIRTTIISPGAVATELPTSVAAPGFVEGVKDFYEKSAIPASSFASMVAFAIGQPDDVDVNEILFRPTAQQD